MRHASYQRGALESKRQTSPPLEPRSSMVAMVLMPPYVSLTEPPAERAMPLAALHIEIPSTNRAVAVVAILVVGVFGVVFSRCPDRCFPTCVAHYFICEMTSAILALALGQALSIVLMPLRQCLRSISNSFTCFSNLSAADLFPTLLLAGTDASTVSSRAVRT